MVSSNSWAETSTTPGTTAPSEKNILLLRLSAHHGSATYIQTRQNGRTYRLATCSTKDGTNHGPVHPTVKARAPTRRLNAYDGVFYRLGLGIFGYSNYRNQISYSGTVTLYTPLNQRFEFRSDIPVANGNGVAAITPTYNFRTNAWKGLVVRGGGGFPSPTAEILPCPVRARHLTPIWL